ncbi:hypothetical protein HUT18_13405 [Streptomyces sp. NA04227]|uniref:hypothetical protein n=1 Tax=Streptomyces sp. NA04227 TaxID=2742136 RepID=UPI001590E97E|nr:hypothetical protein [Streptomyces sp. NA04227]QKW07241.1 hypothetical protein HUT18_13405 [Streptomyces sp. NA04227]
MAAQRPKTQAAREAEELCDELRTALRAVGVTLPSVRVDPVLWGDEQSVPSLIDLGRCNFGTARRLVEVVSKEREL